MATIRVKKFNPASMKESRIVFLIGKRHSGKSVLMRDLLSQMPRPDYVLAMAPTESSLQAFREFVPESCIFDHFSQEKLDTTVALQRQLVNAGKKRTVMILLDDCMYQKGVLKSTSMRSIFFNGRHDHISLVCAAQYMMDIDVALRSNIDYVFTMRESILTNRQKLHKYFFGHYARFDDFERVMATCTQDYKALVLDGTISTTDATDAVFWYKARTEVPSFRLCRSAVWALSARYERSADDVRKAQAQQFVLGVTRGTGVRVKIDGDELHT
jgi:hypothetical protein